MPTMARDMALIIGASLRLTRLITNDDLGEWWIKRPLREFNSSSPEWQRYADLLEEKSRLIDTGIDPKSLETPVPPLDPPQPSWKRYVTGLDCPHCVGYWIGVGVLASYTLARRRHRTLAAWRAIAASLSLNTVVVALGDKIEYWE